jgi:hypothetical protein
MLFVPAVPEPSAMITKSPIDGLAGRVIVNAALVLSVMILSPDAAVYAEVFSTH